MTSSSVVPPHPCAIAARRSHVQSPESSTSSARERRPSLDFGRPRNAERRLRFPNSTPPTCSSSRARRAARAATPPITVSAVTIYRTPIPARAFVRASTTPRLFRSARQPYARAPRPRSRCPTARASTSTTPSGRPIFVPRRGLRAARWRRWATPRVFSASVGHLLLSPQIVKTRSRSRRARRRRARARDRSRARTLWEIHRPRRRSGSPWRRARRFAARRGVAAVIRAGVAASLGDGAAEAVSVQRNHTIDMMRAFLSSSSLASRRATLAASALFYARRSVQADGVRRASSRDVSELNSVTLVLHI